MVPELPENISKGERKEEKKYANFRSRESYVCPHGVGAVVLTANGPPTIRLSTLLWSRQQSVAKGGKKCESEDCAHPVITIDVYVGYMHYLERRIPT